MPRKLSTAKKSLPGFKALLQKSLKLKLLLHLSAVFSCLALSIFFYIEMQNELSGLQVLVKAEAPSFHVKIRSSSALKETEIATYANTLLAKKGRISLSELSKALQREFAAERVSVLAVDASTVYIDLSPRNAALTLLENSEYKISDKGDVYRNARVQEDLVAVSGILPPEPLRILDNGTVFLKERRADAAKSAIKLRHLLAKEGFDYREINYVEHRGFVLNKSSKLPNVMIGEQDFEKRLARLRNILAKDLQRDAVATYIELDYTDKAFIQEKTAQ